MTMPGYRIARAFRRPIATAAMALAMLVIGCGGAGTSYGDLYDEPGYYYPDPWYYAGCCIDRPDDIGPPPPRPEHPIAGEPPHPAHPIATPPGGRPSQPVATPLPQPTPMPRPAVRSGGGFGGGGGGGFRGGGRR